MALDLSKVEDEPNNLPSIRVNAMDLHPHNPQVQNQLSEPILLQGRHIVHFKIPHHRFLPPDRVNSMDRSMQVRVQLEEPILLEDLNIPHLKSIGFTVSQLLGGIEFIRLFDPNYSLKDSMQ